MTTRKELNDAINYLRLLPIGGFVATATKALELQLKAMPPERYIPPKGCKVLVNNGACVRASTGVLVDGSLRCTTLINGSGTCLYNDWELMPGVIYPFEATEDSVNPVPGRQILIELDGERFVQKPRASDGCVWTHNAGWSNITKFILLPEDV